MTVAGTVTKTFSVIDSKPLLFPCCQEDDIPKDFQPQFSIALNISAASKTPNTKTSMRIGQMSDEEKMSLHNFEKQASSKVGDSTEFITEQPTVKSMAEATRNTQFGKVRGQAGEEGKYVFVSYQQKLAAEPMTFPHLRTPPLRNNSNMPGGAHFKKLVQAVVQSRLPADHEECGRAIDQGDCFVFGDAGKHGNNSALMSVFMTDDGTHLPKVAKTLYCHYCEEDRLRGGGS